MIRTSAYGVLVRITVYKFILPKKKPQLTFMEFCATLIILEKLLKQI